MKFLDQAKVYIRSGDKFPILPEIWEELTDKHGPYRAMYAKGERDLRLELSEGFAAIDMLQRAGHRVTLLRPGAEVAAGPLECVLCAQPYRVTKAPAVGEVCASCADHLEVTTPHACTEECVHKARGREAS